MDVTFKRTRAQLRARGLIGPSNRKKAWKKRTRRERINSNNFKLIESGIKGGNGSRVTRLDSEEEWFEDACRIGVVLMKFMNEKWVEVPYLRCVHVKDKGRQLVSLSSARVKEDEVEGGKA